MEKTITVKTAKGNEVELTVKYEIWADGYHSLTDAMEDQVIVRSDRITAKINGKVFENNFYLALNTKKGYVRLCDCGTNCYIALTDESEELIKNTIEEVKKAEEAEKAEILEKCIDSEKEEKERLRKIELEAAQSVIEYVKQGNKVFSSDEAKALKREWIDLQNEGREGYVPHYITVEEVEQAKKIIAEAN